MTTFLKGLPAPIWWIWAGCGACPSGFGSAVNFWAGMWMSAWEATVKCCGVGVAIPQGQSWAPPSLSELTVNTGTVPVLACVSAHPVQGPGLGPSSADRAGTGRSRRSTPSPGKPDTWGRAAAVTRREDAVMPKEAPLNSGAPSSRALMGPGSRVSEMQAKLHRWAAADSSRRFDDVFNFVHDPATLRG